MLQLTAMNQLPATSWPFALAALFALVTLAVLAASRPHEALAHGGGFQLTKSADAGPYELTIGSIPDPPLVGDVILILEVTDSRTDERALGVDVRITPSPPAGSGIEPPPTLWAGPDSYDPTLYETRAELNAEGAWTFAVSVSGDAGDGQATFSYDVKRVNPVGGILTLVVLVALLVIIGLSVRAFLKGRAGSQTPQQARS